MYGGHKALGMVSVYVWHWIGSSLFWSRAGRHEDGQCEDLCGKIGSMSLSVTESRMRIQLVGLALYEEPLLKHVEMLMHCIRKALLCCRSSLLCVLRHETHR